MTPEQFDAEVKEQMLDAIKWHELQVGAIYTIVDVKFINTQYGEACILTLGDETKVFAPSALINHLKLDNKPYPRKTKRSGAIQEKSKSNILSFWISLNGRGQMAF